MLMHCELQLMCSVGMASWEQVVVLHITVAAADTHAVSGAAADTHAVMVMASSSCCQWLLLMLCCAVGQL